MEDEIVIEERVRVFNADPSCIVPPRFSGVQILLKTDCEGSSSTTSHGLVSTSSPSTSIKFWTSTGNRGTARPHSETGLPPRHIRTIGELHDLSSRFGGIVDLVECSHIERSEVNLRNLLTQVEQSELKVKYVILTDRGCGEGGKRPSLRALTSGSVAHL